MQRIYREIVLVPTPCEWGSFFASVSAYLLSTRIARPSAAGLLNPRARSLQPLFRTA